jgi:transposase
MDIHTMLQVQKMYEDEDVDFNKWLRVTMQELEVHEDERYKEHQRSQSKPLQ